MFDSLNFRTKLLAAVIAPAGIAVAISVANLLAAVGGVSSGTVRLIGVAGFVAAAVVAVASMALVGRGPGEASRTGPVAAGRVKKNPSRAADTPVPPALLPRPRPDVVGSGEGGSDHDPSDHGSTITAESEEDADPKAIAAPDWLTMASNGVDGTEEPLIVTEDGPSDRVAAFDRSSTVIGPRRPTGPLRSPLDVTAPGFGAPPSGATAEFGSTAGPFGADGLDGADNPWGFGGGDRGAPDLTADPYSSDESPDGDEDERGVDFEAPAGGDAPADHDPIAPADLADDDLLAGHDGLLAAHDPAADELLVDDDLLADHHLTNDEPADDDLLADHHLTNDDGLRAGHDPLGLDLVANDDPADDDLLADHDPAANDLLAGYDPMGHDLVGNDGPADHPLGDESLGDEDLRADHPLGDEDPPVGEPLADDHPLGDEEPRAGEWVSDQARADRSSADDVFGARGDERHDGHDEDEATVDHEDDTESEPSTSSLFGLGSERATGSRRSRRAGRRRRGARSDELSAEHAPLFARERQDQATGADPGDADPDRSERTDEAATDPTTPGDPTDSEQTELDLGDLDPTDLSSLAYLDELPDVVHDAEDQEPAPQTPNPMEPPVEHPTRRSNDRPDPVPPDESTGDQATSTSLSAVTAGAPGPDAALTFALLARRGRRLIGHQLEHLRDIEAAEAAAADVPTAGNETRGGGEPEQLRRLARLRRLTATTGRAVDSLAILASPTADPAADDERVPIRSLLRMAVDTVERHPAVEFGTIDDCSLPAEAGRAVAHIVAELIDNAATAGPDRPVEVSGVTQLDDTYLVVVTDRGPGLDQPLIDAANAIIAEAPDPYDEPSPALGLIIIGRLARRLGVIVELAPSPTGTGIAALVLVPGPLVERPSLLGAEATA